MEGFEQQPKVGGEISKDDLEKELKEQGGVEILPDGELEPPAEGK